MSQAVIDRLTSKFGERILETSDAFGDHEARVAIDTWTEVAQFIRDDRDAQMDHFIECLQRGVESHCSLDDAALTHEVVFGALECYRSNRPVQLASLR